MLEKLGQYRILEPIGADPNVELYRARDLRAGRTVVIRMAPETAGDSGRQAELRQRALAMMSWSHPNVAALYEVGEEDGRLFLVSEFVPGQPLAELMGGRPLNPQRALGYTIQLADALAVAHAEGAVHGNIGVRNVVITPKGSAKFLDFGLWPSTATDATASESRGDIASLGVVLLEMLKGRGAGPDATPSLPSNLASIVRKMLERDPARQYESAATLASELRTIADALEARDAGAEFRAMRFDDSVRSDSAGAGRIGFWIVVALVATAVAWFVVRAWLR